MANNRPELVLLYDGVCVYCDGMVKFILARDRKGTMKFAPLQGEFAAGVMSRHEELRHLDALILVQTGDGPGDERVWNSSEAAIRAWEYLGGAWGAASLLRVVPRVFRDWCYDRFASVRYRLFGTYDSCPIPAPEVRARFMA